MNEIPYETKFDSYTTSEEVMEDADVKGKIYIVTGATTGFSYMFFWTI